MKYDGKTRVFYVVSSENKNREIFDSYEDACDFYNTFAYGDHANIMVAQVKNAYKEDGKWNYEDLSDTFKQVAYI